MKRLQRAAILLSLAKNLKDHGSWCGETHIQKAAYFLQQMLGVPLGFEFTLYKHGPFSFDLNDEITAMRADALIRLQPQPYPYGPSLLPDEGSELLKDRFPKTLKRYDNQVKFIAEKLGSKKVTELECLATALYVTYEFDGDVETRARKINELKPHISVDEARSAAHKVDQIIKESQQIPEERAT
ncbi:MAG: hypothetical protein AB1611_19865 [bacterium]